jgi:hypothetical protein
MGKVDRFGTRCIQGGMLAPIRAFIRIISVHSSPSKSIKLVSNRLISPPD